ncbi:Endoribonuclease L-PSP [Methylobrevis pamukkalensis]|uniref:Endoribonuclease L-PSP n=1 Tax=Methylobrevis pamukkalensis TaxID=1439726 RepID=A0A1E3H110_9HYPH|nr:Endoribonuclease L-PSP [Methylobrevis pamukkalensis]
MSGAIEARIAELGHALPDAPAPAANYVPFVVTGHLVFISGQISKSPSGEIVTGHLGGGVEVAAGQQAARICALNILAQAKARSAISTGSAGSCASTASSPRRRTSPTIRR